MEYILISFKMQNVRQLYAGHIRHYRVNFQVAIYQRLIMVCDTTLYPVLH